MVRIVYLFLLFSCFIACHKKKEEQEKAIEVTTIIVKRETIPLPLDLVGITQSSHPVDIWARVEGYLNKIDYVEGSFVNEGDVLFEIDAAEFENAVKEAQANLEREQANLWSAQKAVERFRPLFEEKAASRKDLEDAETQLRVEQAAVSLYQTKLNEAQLNLSYTKITSPISGLSSSANYREGTLITPGTNGLLTTISVIDPIWVVISVSDYYFLISNEQVAKGELTIPPNYDFNVKLMLEDGSPYPYEGKVSFISPILDPKTGTLTVRAVFPNPQGTLKPGEFVRATALGANRPNAIAVPQISVQQGAGGKYVYIINKQKRAELRYVTTGDWIGDNWFIDSGLEEGDEIVVTGMNKIQNGTLVKVIQTQ